jgi:hypothetical protein
MVTMTDCAAIGPINDRTAINPSIFDFMSIP